MKKNHIAMCTAIYIKLKQVEHDQMEDYLCSTRLFNK